MGRWIDALLVRKDDSRKRWINKKLTQKNYWWVFEYDIVALGLVVLLTSNKGSNYSQKGKIKKRTYDKGWELEQRYMVLEHKLSPCYSWQARVEKSFLFWSWVRLSPLFIDLLLILDPRAERLICLSFLTGSATVCCPSGTNIFFGKKSPEALSEDSIRAHFHNSCSSIQKD